MRRRRQSRTPLQRSLDRFRWELGRSLSGLLPLLSDGLWRHPVTILGLGGAALWLSWPVLAPGVMDLGRFGAGGQEQEVISVFVEDPERTAWALNIWKARPGSLLILQGRPSSQEANESKLRSQNLWPSDRRGMVRLEPGCDTVGQIDALARYLSTLPHRGRITLVTSPAHLERSLAIARIVIGPMGWTVEGMAAVTDDNRPESSARLWRDQVRAHVLRLTGLTGSEPDPSCP